MSFSKFCTSDFQTFIRRKGEEYFRHGRVHDLTVYEDGATAQVYGQDSVYDVELNFHHRDSGGLIAECTCPYYDQGEFCKHIWAVLLTLDRSCELRLTRGREVAVIHADALDEDGKPYPEVFPDYRAKYEVSCNIPTEKRRPSGNWKRLLNEIASDSDYRQLTEKSRSHKENESSDRQIWYVLDVGASQQAGHLTIDILYRLPTKRGGWQKPKRLSVSREVIDSISNPEDRTLLGLLFGNRPIDNRYSGYYTPTFSSSFNRCQLAPSSFDVVLPRLVATERFVWMLDSSLSFEDFRPVVWQDGSPWKCELRMETDHEGQQWKIIAEFCNGDQRRVLKDAVLLLPDQLILFTDQLARCEITAELPWVKLMMKKGPINIPFQDRPAWLSELLGLRHIPKIEFPESFEVERVAVEPQPRLEIKSPKRKYYSWDNELVGTLSFNYDGQSFQYSDKSAGRFDQETNRFLLRNHEREKECERRLLELGCRELPQYYGAQGDDIQIPERALPSLVRALIAENWVVETQGIRVRRPGEFKLDVTTSVDWFELDAKVDFDGVKVALPALLAAMRKNETFIRLDDGSQGVLPEEWLQKYAKLAQLADANGDVLRFGTSQGLLLDALLAEQENVQVDQGFADFRDKMRKFSGVKPATPTPTFKGELRNYQKEGLGWLHFLREFRLGGCLADDMGLGKTVQVLALLESRRTRELKEGEVRRPSIVVVPKSLVFNWIDEASRFAPELRVLNFTGIERGDRYKQTDDYDLIITTYGTLRRDVVKLKKIRFDYAVLDEAQAIKNSDSQAAKACRLIGADHRLAMTGTPVENHLGELWSLFDFLNPGMLGRSSAFSSFTRASREYDAEGLQLLARAVRPFLLRRTKTQVLTELPEKTEQTLYCELSGKERKAYDELRDYYRAQLTRTVSQKGLAKSKIHVLEALLRLRQAACHPGLLDKTKTEEVSAKLESLLDQVEEVVAEGHKALVFSQFTSYLDIVRQHLDKREMVYEYLDGQTRDRAARVKRFQEDPACPLFLISLKAGGQGLNLTAADYVFILDPWWNPAVEAQAVDRAHRIGQTKRVFAYRLIARGTVEDKILELQKSKRDLADAIVSANNSLIRSLTAEDLELLLS